MNKRSFSWHYIGYLEHRQLLAQSDENRRVAGWTMEQFKNGALSALLPLEVIG
jgi:hypothetical protein